MDRCCCIVNEVVIEQWALGWTKKMEYFTLYVLSWAVRLTKLCHLPAMMPRRRDIKISWMVVRSLSVGLAVRDMKLMVALVKGRCVHLRWW